MSQHHFTTSLDGRLMLVVAGYDRPLDDLFLTVFDLSADGDDEGLFTSLLDTRHDWADPAILLASLARLRLQVPATFLAAILEDQRLRAGNKIVIHHVNRPPQVMVF
ncbi:MAG TPA: hypothetical protein VFR86_11705 [Burkholderiaceae bacterium]|nr:hypothetical protein [Burkholderiaceae bacterium]